MTTPDTIPSIKQIADFVAYAEAGMLENIADLVNDRLRVLHNAYEPTFKIGDEICVVVSRQEPNFDKACEFAIRQALGRFDVDECGNIRGVKDAERSSCSIELEFDTLKFGAGMAGHSYDYIFKAKVVKHEE